MATQAPARPTDSPVEADLIQVIPVAKIDMDAAQVRAKTCRDTIAEYREEYEAGEEFPLPHLFTEDGSIYWIGDGHHRVPAMLDAGIMEIEAYVHEGNADDAEWFALEANKRNGLRMNNADKRHAVFLALQNPHANDISDRELARKIGGVSHEMVRQVRKQLEKGQLDDYGNVVREQQPKPDREPGERLSTVDTKATERDDYTPEPEVPETLCDQFDVPIPEQAVDAMAMIPEWDDAAQAIVNARAKVKRLAGGVSGQHFDETSCMTHLKNAHSEVTSLAPFAVCPYCKGNDSRCKACHGFGYVHKLLYKAASKELKGQA